MSGNQKEEMEEVRARLLRLRELSRDPDYNQYLDQMRKDLESGKATPGQVAREADRTYRLYQERFLGQQSKNTEFKIGAAIFSIVGAVFVLTAFILFGVNFLTGIWQGLCLYGVAVTVILISELLVKRLSVKVCGIITAIGTAGLFVSTILNYAVLGNMNELAALVVTLVISLFCIFLGRKRDSAALRLITVLGCYLCFFPGLRRDSEFVFLGRTVLLLVVNIAALFLSRQKNRRIVSGVHMAVCTAFMWVLPLLILPGGSAESFLSSQVLSGIIYMAGYLLGGLIPFNLIYFRERALDKPWFNVLYCVFLGISFFSAQYALLLYSDYADQEVAFFWGLMMELQILAVSLIFFVLWEKDRRRWSQYYFLMGSLLYLPVLATVYETAFPVGTAGQEILLAVRCGVVMAVFLLTRFLSGVGELTALDGMTEVLAAICGLTGVGHQRIEYTWVVGILLLLALGKAKRALLFHEIVLLLYFIAGDFLPEALFPEEAGLGIPFKLGMILLLFLLVNHLPGLKRRRNLPYNIISVVLLFFCSTWIVAQDAYGGSILAMILGTAGVLVMFRPRYGMEFPHRYFLAEGYFIVMIFLAHFRVPAITSAFLMLAALLGIGTGCWKKDSRYRIFGMVLALFACAKLLAFDLFQLEALTKVIIFFIVGIAALVISFLYLHLEKGEKKERQPEQVQTYGERNGEE